MNGIGTPGKAGIGGNGSGVEVELGGATGVGGTGSGTGSGRAGLVGVVGTGGAIGGLSNVGTSGRGEGMVGSSVPASGGGGNFTKLIGGSAGFSFGNKIGTVKNSRRPVEQATSAPYWNPIK